MSKSDRILGIAGLAILIAITYGIYRVIEIAPGMK